MLIDNSSFDGFIFTMTLFRAITFVLEDWNPSFDMLFNTACIGICILLSEFELIYGIINYLSYTPIGPSDAVPAVGWCSSGLIAKE